MGTSARYSSASDKPELLAKDIADASGSSPISAIPDHELAKPAKNGENEDIRAALARVDQSLKLVLTHIAAIQREMGIDTSLVHDVPLKPDESWNGSP